MKFNDHTKFEGRHAFLGASNYHWLNYDKEKLVNTYYNALAKERGTELHEFAATCIKLSQKLARSKQTLNLYVNDAVSFGMEPEVILFYSANCFGTADAISFRDNTLRIHDLKTGETPAKFDQLYIYAALFCLEYKKDPGKIDIFLRIYQDNDFDEVTPDPDDINDIMKKIVSFDKILYEIITEEE